MCFVIPLLALLCLSLPAFCQQDPPPAAWFGAEIANCARYEDVCGAGQTSSIVVYMTLWGMDIGAIDGWCICMCDGAYVGPGCYGPRCPPFHATQLPTGRRDKEAQTPAPLPPGTRLVTRNGVVYRETELERTLAFQIGSLTYGLRRVILTPVR